MEEINQLADRQIDENTHITLDYDAIGIRTRKGNITYTIDGSRILTEIKSSETLR